LDEVFGAEEHFSEAFFDLFVWKTCPFLLDQDPDVFGVFLSPAANEMVSGQLDINLLSERPEGEGGIGELFQILDHSSPYGVAVDIPDTGEVVLIGVDDTGPVPVAPEVSGSPDMFVVPDGGAGVEVLHGPVEVFLGGGGDDMVVVGHEDDVMDEKAIFLHGFGKGMKEDADNLPLVEAEGPVVGPADQMVGVGCLNDP